MEINRDEIASKLTDKGAHLPCHRCGHTTFSIIDGYSNYIVQANIEDLTKRIGGRSLPVILVVCENCGAITPHAFKALDSLPNEGQKND